MLLLSWALRGQQQIMEKSWRFDPWETAQPWGLKDSQRPTGEPPWPLHYWDLKAERRQRLMGVAGLEDLGILLSGAMPLSCGFCWEAPRMHSYLVGPTECSDSPVLGAWSHCWQHITRGRRRSARAQCPFIPSDEIFSMIIIWMAWERRWRWISFQWDWWLGHRSEAGDAFSSVTSYWSH